MKDFMDRDFLLETETAKRLFHQYAEHLPLVDYHCHISPKEIYEDRRFRDIVEVWLGGQQPDGSYFGDHYKWRLMRANGVPEQYVTGNAPQEERLKKFAEALELAVGNPMYHWCHLELKQFFSCNMVLSPENVHQIFELTRDKLQNDPSMTARGMIQKANVEMIGTTDDPIDTLEWHEKLAADPTVTFKVCPSFRPDKAVNIAKEGFADYIRKLAQSVGKPSLDTVEEVCAALSQRLEHFKKLGCRASDHGLDYVPFRLRSSQENNAAFRKAMSGEVLSVEEAEGYQTALLLHLGKEYHRLGIVMQLHYSCSRNVNQRLFRTIGPDAGTDTIAQNSCGEAVGRLLNALELEHACPKTILYSLNPGDNALLAAMAGCFQSDELPGKIQHGSAWWFNDTKSGMEDQMRSLASVGLLGNFVGMLTDSRSFLSYARHDYFRRIFCNLVGRWVENGEYPADEQVLRRITEGVCYRNAARYFEL